MKNIYKLTIAISVISLSFGALFFDNIKGYYRFTEYCEKESGFKKYENLASDYGWLVDDFGDPMAIAYLNGVRFVRYKDKLTDKYFDMKYISGDPHAKKSFQIEDSNFNESTKYKWVNVSYFVDGEIRLSKYGNELIDDKGNKILSVYEFSYAKFNRDHTPLDMNPIVRCPWQYKSQKEAFDSWVEKMNYLFD